MDVRQVEVHTMGETRAYWCVFDAGLIVATVNARYPRAEDLARSYAAFLDDLKPVPVVAA